MSYVRKRPIRSNPNESQASDPNSLSESHVVSFTREKKAYHGVNDKGDPETDTEETALSESKNAEHRALLKNSIVRAPNPDDFPNLTEFQFAWDEWSARIEIQMPIARVSAKQVWEQRQLEKQFYPICPKCRHLNILRCNLLGLQFDGSNFRKECELFEKLRPIFMNVQQPSTDVHPNSSLSNGLPVLSGVAIADLTNLSKDELLDSVVTQHDEIAKIERMELELAFCKLERARAAGFYLQEFKRRCKHGEFERKLIAKGIKPRTAQDYMTIARHWHWLEEKARNSAFMESCQVLSLNWALNAVREEKRLKSAAPSNESDDLASDSSPETSSKSLLSEKPELSSVADRTLDHPVTSNFASVRDEETAKAARVGLTNGKQLLPDLRESDRDQAEMWDPTIVDDRPGASHNVVPEFVGEDKDFLKNILFDEEIVMVENRPIIDNISNWCRETSQGVLGNSDRFSHAQATAMIKALLLASFPQRAKQLLAALSEQQIKSLILLGDEELDSRSVS